MNSPAKMSLAHGGPLRRTPEDPLTLSAALRRAAACAAGELIYVDSEGAQTAHTYDELRREAERISGGLFSLGLRPGDRVLLQLPSPRDFIPALWGCVLGGMIPAPVSVPPSYEPTNVVAARLYAAWQTLERPWIVAPAAGREPLLRLTTSLGDERSRVADIEELRTNTPSDARHESAPEDHVLYLLTSGSTGRPKAVMLSHTNLLSMAAGTIQMNGFDASSVTLNWLPLDHVGAVSFLHVMPVLLGCQQVHVSTEAVLQDPLMWVELLAKHRATIGWAPNFAFRLVAEQLSAEVPGTWDLSDLSFLVNAGESVVAGTVKQFWQTLAPQGLKESALRPAFGMSETASGITWSEGIAFDEAVRDDSVADLGRPIPAASARIVDDQQQVVEEGVVGQLQLSGPSVFAGYFRQPELNAEVFTDDGWLRTGDLGLLRDGRLTVTGRDKELIIIHGVHYHGHHIESVVESVAGVESSYTAACAVRPRGSDTDRLAIFFSSSANDRNGSVERLQAIRREVILQVGVNPEFLISLSKDQIPRTAIGKIQRSQLKQRFERGEFDDLVRDQKRSVRSSGHVDVGQSHRGNGKLERLVAEVWQQVLSVDRAGLNENFFELGGTSILLARIAQQLGERLDVTITTADVLAYPTIRSLADFLHQQHSGADASTAGAASPARKPRRGVDSEGIAVIGMACRFPGAADIDQFWKNLRDGVDSVTSLTDDELVSAGVSPSRLKTPNYVKALPWLEGIDRFDAKLFGYSDDDARLMDPQHRLFLECASQTLEEAGYDPFRYDDRIGIFGAAGMNTYMARYGLEPELADDFLTNLTAASTDFLTTRVSYKLNLRGPSLTVQTACSSGLVAAHLACQSLMRGECEMALAGAVSIWHLQRHGYVYHPGGLVSPDGRCRAFDQQAQGMVFGNGVGIVLLKPLDRALAEGDHVRAVIKGSAMNNDGAVKAGFTATGMAGQIDVVADAIDQAGVPADSIHYVECHGTGTLLGDAIELGALTQAMRRSTRRRNFCAVGSVKSNIGHMGVACGIAGLIKTVMALEHKQLPPTIHVEEPNNQFEFADSPFYVNTRLASWEAASQPRRAAVSSLGLGGTNAHLVLEERANNLDSRQNEATATESPQLLIFSAKTPRAVDVALQNMASFLITDNQSTLADIAYTLQVGRRELPQRRMLVAHDTVDAAAVLTQSGPRIESRSGDQTVNGPRVFFFPGSDSFDVRIASQLYVAVPDFRRSADRLIQHCERLLSVDLGDVFSASRRAKLDVAEAPFAAERSDAIVADAAQLVCQCALAELWIAWGIHPDALLASGIGRLAAGYVAGVFAISDAAKLLQVASLRKLHGKETRNLVSDSEIDCATWNAPNVPVLSSSNGQAIDANDLLRPDAWLEQLATCDGTDETVNIPRELSAATVLQISPSESMQAVSCPGSSDAEGPMLLASFSCIDDEQQAQASILTTLGRLWLAGATIDWPALHGGPRRRVSLPAYPFQHQSYWIGAPPDAVSFTGILESNERHPQVQAVANARVMGSTGGEDAETAERPSSHSDIRDRLLAAPRGRRVGLLVDHLRKQIATLLSVEASAMPEADTGFLDMGMTSIMMVELLVSLEKVFGRRLPQTLALECPNIHSLAENLVENLTDSSSSVASEHDAEPPAEHPGTALNQLQELSDDQVIHRLRSGLGDD